jgi:hypothetical protein
VICFGSKNGYQKDMGLKEIGLHVQNMITILGSIVNSIGRDLYDHLMSTIIFTLKNKIDII